MLPIFIFKRPDMLTRETKQALNEIDQEIKVHDPVSRNYQYKAFTSRSKGIRNGKRRVRRNWKDVELVKYREGSFHQWHNFPFDEAATETLPGWEEWKAIEHIQNKLRGEY